MPFRSLLCILVLWLGGCAPTPSNPTTPTGHNNLAPHPERYPAPSLEGGSAWLNTDRPLDWSQLRGHVVVVDFWTYCCINCLHVLPELARLEREFADQPVVVLGVHSGKFDAEKDAARIESAIVRHGVAHPVVVDPERAIWRRWGVKAWPTLAVVGPDGQVVAMGGGEPDLEALRGLIETELAAGRRAGSLAPERIALGNPLARPAGPLAFPGKVAVGPAGDRIAIADSGNHRVVLTDLAGQTLATFGRGLAGMTDGSSDEASFRYPQGLAFSEDGTALFVADTENHALRRIDIDAGRVTTIAGTGEKGEVRLKPGASVAGRRFALRSPWALARRGDDLFVAMAGAHQIYRFDITRGTMALFAGNGRERLDDAPLLKASFAQPSGLSLVNQTLYVADSEGSAIRAIDLDQGRVRTIVGTGLFDFGDRDGVGDDVRLQHALGLVARGDALFVADTFNGKLKRLLPGARRVETVGDGFAEPGGLALLPDGRLLVADTNHHRIATFDPTTRQTVALDIRGLTSPRRGVALVAASGAASPTELRLEADGALRVGDDNVLTVELLPAVGTKLTDGAPASLSVKDTSPGLTASQTDWRRAIDETQPLRFEVPLASAGEEGGHLILEARWFYCDKGDVGACYPAQSRVDVRLTAGGDGRPSISLRAERED